MSLDLDKIALRVDEMATHLNADDNRRQRHLAQALTTLADKSS
jgi:hypothetical protein